VTADIRHENRVCDDPGAGAGILDGRLSVERVHASADESWRRRQRNVGWLPLPDADGRSSSP